MATAPKTLPLSSELIDRIRKLRDIERVSAQMLADRMTSLGYPVTRGVIANCEAKRVADISIDFASCAAFALGTTLPRLLEQPVVCPTCEGEPPEGFTCNTCGGAA